MLTRKQIWYRENREYAIQETARWQKRNRERVRASGARYRRSEKYKAWRKKNRKHLAERQLQRITPEYNTWIHMKCRCMCKTNAAYDRYGGRGIKVCKRWIYSFKNFLTDMGLRPKGRSLDRINNDGNYTPKNCRWATSMEQHRNRRSFSEQARRNIGIAQRKRFAK